MHVAQILTCFAGESKATSGLEAIHADALLSSCWGWVRADPRARDVKIRCFHKLLHPNTTHTDNICIVYRCKRITPTNTLVPNLYTYTNCVVCLVTAALGKEGNFDFEDLKVFAHNVYPSFWKLLLNTMLVKKDADDRSF